MSDLVGNPEDRFSRVEAHIILIWRCIATSSSYLSSVSKDNSLSVISMNGKNFPPFP